MVSTYKSTASYPMTNLFLQHRIVLISLRLHSLVTQKVSFLILLFEMGVFSRKKLYKTLIIVVASPFFYFTLINIFKPNLDSEGKNFYNSSDYLRNSRRYFGDINNKEKYLVDEGQDEKKTGESRKFMEKQFLNSSELSLTDFTKSSTHLINASIADTKQINNRSKSINEGSHGNELKTAKDHLQKGTKLGVVIEKTQNISKIPTGSGLHVRIWHNTVVFDIMTFCAHPLFPKGPNERSVLSKLEIQRNESYFAQQIFGYLHPSSSGWHTFALASDDNSEVWLREEGSTEGARKICYVGNQSDTRPWTFVDEFDKFLSQKSKPIFLDKEKKYFIEVLHVQNIAQDNLQVAWQQPGTTSFSIIDYKSTSLVSEQSLRNSTVIGDVFLSEACKDRADYHHLKRGGALRVERPRYIEHEELRNALSGCSYRPDYINRLGPLPKEQWYFLRIYHVPTYCYPWIVYPGVKRLPTYEDHPLEFTEAESLVKEYMENVEKSYPGVYKLGSILKVEKKHDNDKGARYLLELNVTKNDNESTIISEYIYKNASSKTMCYPENLQWKRNTHIALIISIRNQGTWMRHFLDNLEDIYSDTDEQNVSLIVFDYESDDADIEEELKARRLPPYTLIQQPGVYSRCRSINTAAQAVRDPYAIIFTLDLHLEIPNTIFDDVRKHCFEGRSVYTPVIVRLYPGYTPRNAMGYWEQQGFGLIAMYKSDWDRVGGLDEQTFKNKWGGEDWELMERVVGSGMEYERIRNFKMYHYFHTKKGMWTGDEAIQNATL